jgi:hypothetical protein
VAETETPDVTAPPSSAAETPAPATPASDSSPAPSSSAPDSTSPSSGDGRQSDREGLLAAVKKVVETTPEKPAIPSSSQDQDADAEPPGPVSQDQAAATAQAETPPDATTAEPDPTEAELRKLRPETRRRFERLLSQRNEARQTIESLQPELQEHRQLQGYLKEHQLAPEDVNMLLGVGSALRRGDYQGFLQGVTPYVMAAQEALGLRINPDLQKQVDEGMIDENTAKELTRTRHRAAQAEARLQDANRQVESTQQVQHVGNIRAAVDTWEAGIQRRDPDYGQMAGAVRRYAQGLLQERGIPRTPQEAVALTQTAYDEVKATFAAVRPAPRPTRSNPSSIHVATGTPSAQPRDLREAVVMAIANSRRPS